MVVCLGMKEEGVGWIVVVYGDDGGGGGVELHWSRTLNTTGLFVVWIK